MNIIENTTITMLPISRLKNNSGQIDGVPTNPRTITDKAFDKLCKRLSENNLTGINPLKVVEQDDEFIVLGGNQRLRALKKLGAKNVPCIVVPGDTPIDILREIVIIDNTKDGDNDWGLLDSEWDAEELQRWGIELPKVKETEKLSSLTYRPIYYEPQITPNLKLSDCIDCAKYEQKLKVIEDEELDEETKEQLKKLAYRFIRIDFGKIADYYAFNATDKEKEVLERLRVVLTDNGINGYVEDDLLRLKERISNFEETDDEE